MSAVIAVPELMAQAATDLTAIGETLNAAHMTAAGPTVALVPAAADEVSTSIAHLLSGYGQEYQKLAGEATACYEQFAQHLTASAGAYASAEAGNVASLQPLTPSAASTPLGALVLGLGLNEPLFYLVGGALGLQFVGILLLAPFLLPLVPLLFGALILEALLILNIEFILFGSVS